MADLTLGSTQVLHAPHLIDAEVVQVFRRFERVGEMHAGRAGEALSDLRSLRLVRHPHEPLLHRVWALRDNLSAYDALYVVLAEALEVPLITRDRALQAAPGHRAEVRVV